MFYKLAILFLLCTSPLKTFAGAYATPAHTHWITESRSDGFLVLEDGSNWKIASQDMHKLYDWHFNDAVFIYPNQNPDSLYNYVLTNTRLYSSVAMNLYLGPGVNNPHRKTIVSMDYQSHHLFLNNGSCWHISKESLDSFKNWEVGDTVIIGTNPGWLCKYDSILINVDMNNFAYCKLF